MLVKLFQLRYHYNQNLTAFHIYFVCTLSFERNFHEKKYHCHKKYIKKVWLQIAAWCDCQMFAFSSQQAFLSVPHLLIIHTI